MLPSGTTDKLEGRSWRKWREARVISERGDDMPCREAAELEPPLGGRLMWADGDVWQATNG